MATCQSSLLCAPQGLLLLIGVISSHLPEVRAKPTDFWCNRQVRKNMEERIETLKNDTVNCVGSDTLSSPVQLPCVRIHAQEWEKKTLQQKHAEVVGSLQMFRDGVQGARNQITVQCQSQLLKTLEHHIRNYLAIFNRLQIQTDTVTPTHSAVQMCSSQTSLNKVLEQYKNLLKGKVNHFAVDLQDSNCKMEHITTEPLG